MDRGQRSLKEASPYVHTIEIIFLAFGLAMDAFAVSVSVGSTHFMVSKRARFRISFHFGLFQFLMPIIGWLGGNFIESTIKRFDHWIALLLLAYVGIKMMRESMSQGHREFRFDPSKGWNLVILSIATSIDALAVGLSLALISTGIWQPAILTGLITGFLSLIGILIGDRIGHQIGKKVEFAGGVVLILIGLKIAIEHLIH
jgi:putative Mn2+ efflux pump MntP